MKIYFKYLLYLFVFIAFNASFAGSYDDFFKAIELDQPEVVSNLLARGFDPNSPSPQGVPALLLCYQKKSVKVLDLLIAAKPTHMNVQNSSGENLLMLAALDNQLGLVETLIDKGADINKPGWTALHYAASKGHIEMIRLLLDNQAYIDAESPNGTTPLMMAARYATPKTVKLLLEEGADPRIRNQPGFDALQMAQKHASSESAAYVQAFLSAWNEKYNNTNAQVVSNDAAASTPAPADSDGADMPVTQTSESVDHQPDQATSNAAVSIEPLTIPVADTADTNATATEEATTVQDSEAEAQEPLSEAITGAPVVLKVIEASQVTPEGPADILEIRPADAASNSSDAVNSPSIAGQIQIKPIDVPAVDVPYTRQIRSRAVVTVKLPDDDPPETDTPDQSANQ